MDKFLMITNFFVGIVVASYSLRLLGKMDKCTNKNIRNSLTGLLATSLILVVSSLSFVVCNISCDCSGVKSFSKTVYIIYFVLLGIVITTLGSIVSVTSKNDKDCKQLSSESNVLWILGVVIILTSIIFGVIEYRQKIGQSILSARQNFRQRNIMSYR